PLDGAHVLFDVEEFHRAVRQSLAKLRLSLEREYRELVVRAAPGAKREPQEGLFPDLPRRLLEQPHGRGDLEIAADDGRPVGAFAGSLADDDPEGMIRP